MTVLREAQNLVYGPREELYSHPARDYAKTAKMWTGLLLEKLKPGVEITPKEAVLMMAWKLSREVFVHKRDNLVDAAGYIECASRIAEAESPITGRHVDLQVVDDLIYPLNYFVDKDGKRLRSRESH